MKVHCVSSQSFGQIRYGKSVLDKIFSQKVDRKILMQLQNFTLILKEKKFDAAPNLDVVIEDSFDKGFFAVVTNLNKKNKSFAIPMRDIIKMKSYSDIMI